jgi:hypothetical protein
VQLVDQPEDVAEDYDADEKRALASDDLSAQGLDDRNRPAEAETD